MPVWCVQYCANTVGIEYIKIRKNSNKERSICLFATFQSKDFSHCFLFITVQTEMYFL